jgi:hypothetical protein
MAQARIDPDHLAQYLGGEALFFHEECEVVGCESQSLVRPPLPRVSGARHHHLLFFQELANGGPQYRLVMHGAPCRQHARILEGARLPAARRRPRVE